MLQCPALHLINVTLRTFGHVSGPLPGYGGGAGSGGGVGGGGGGGGGCGGGGPTMDECGVFGVCQEFKEEPLPEVFTLPALLAQKVLSLTGLLEQKYRY